MDFCDQVDLIECRAADECVDQFGVFAHVRACQLLRRRCSPACLAVFARLRFCADCELEVPWLCGFYKEGQICSLPHHSGPLIRLCVWGIPRVPRLSHGELPGVEPAHATRLVHRLALAYVHPHAQAYLQRAGPAGSHRGVGEPHPSQQGDETAEAPGAAEGVDPVLRRDLRRRRGEGRLRADDDRDHEGFVAVGGDAICIVLGGCHARRRHDHTLVLEA
mmetsp:Transcript_14520/g.36818  ORF Transcript_14520/g.36818 Transcript_14520/m.36818 type:complete len:220 (-) Transcript_14520:812-1471(-)